jgi:hypothetical protein
MGKPHDVNGLICMPRVDRKVHRKRSDADCEPQRLKGNHTLFCRPCPEKGVNVNSIGEEKGDHGIDRRRLEPG